VKQYSRFCHEYQYTAFPITKHALCHFIAKEAPNRRASSMTQLIASLKSHHIDCGYSNEIFENDGQIKRILRGVKIVNGIKPTNNRLPITRDIVQKLVAQCNNSFNDVVMRAAICVAFAGFLRTGEFTYDSWNSSSHQSNISRGAITFNHGSVTLTLPKSKTDPFSMGVPISMPGTYDSICPREALKRLMFLYPAPADAPLFSCNNQYGYLQNMFFTRGWFLDSLRNLLIKAGINPVGYSGHSFRKGAAHTAAAAGMSDQEIKTLGRWKSNAYKLYTGHDDVRRLQLAKTITHNLRSAAPRSQRDLGGVPGRQ
jgi:hypothetical protein